MIWLFQIVPLNILKKVAISEINKIILKSDNILRFNFNFENILKLNNGNINNKNIICFDNENKYIKKH